MHNYKNKTLTKGLGIHSNTRGSFAQWYYVFVPYCTGDGHIGNSTTKYLDTTVHHKGHVNFMTALDWAVKYFPEEMEEVTIVGSSAGSVGALVNWPFIANRYPKAQIKVFADSYVGVFAEDQYNQGMVNWNAQFPTFVPGVSISTFGTWTDGIMCRYAQTLALWAPDARIGLYTSDHDVIQTGFYTAGFGPDGVVDPTEWTNKMRAIVSCYQQNTATVHTYIGTGDSHVTSQTPGYFSVVADDVHLAAWVDLLIERGGVYNVDCADDGECASTPALNDTHAARNAN